MSPEKYAQDRAAASGSSFYYAFLFLPPDRRAAITAFYAFCREVDDVVDEVSDPGVAQSKLAWWRHEVAQAFQGRPQHPAMQALMPHASAFGIEPRHLLAVIDGCQMDLDQNRYLDFQQLQQYCHLVAGIVGEVAARIFGQSQVTTTQYAHTLGLALQLTNISRDVGEDARRGRVYLPISELQQFNVKAHELLRPPEDAAEKADFELRFSALMAFQCQRAQQTYDKAIALLPAQDRGPQKPGLMMASIYRQLLRRIERDPVRVLHERVSLSPMKKLWLAWKVQALGRL
ncbi:presqualene diphosphate synthase HpnD [Hydrogenophaga sp. 5NK40-0174]|uniref:presqualene diphosphate synthase HpnD n=1 Tax=Hydrogenophaga sp. 5NK40-0174 TaxID=3127649 RepID=UPI0031025F61